ncbi:MAG: trimeric intracellular cation channel family protein [Alcanivoracaceae bacterium]|nr:trimeric intracellular cation channel family protein [Alcanivoracaceae bacterium]
MLLYYLDLAGVAVFAVSGVLAARDRDLDLFGVLVVAAITAIGGGTLRDLLLDRHPIFWITDTWYLVVILAATLLTVIYLRLRQPPGISLQVADAFGLGLFALSGAQYAEAANSSPMIVVLMGTMTGVTGGVIRDVITAKVPLILRQEIYATAAIVGVLVYLGMKQLGVPASYAFPGGILVVVSIRLVAIRWGLHLPVVHRP